MKTKNLLLFPIVLGMAILFSPSEDGRFLSSSVGCVFGADSKESTLTVWPAPKGEAVTNAYSVKVNGKNVDLYSAQSQDEGKEYYFASFDFTGRVSIEITSPFSLDKMRIGPDRFGVKVNKKEAQSLTLEADKPFQISIEPNGRIKPLLLFGNAPDTNVPSQDDKNVVYFGPGVHRTGKIVLKDNQTLYIAGGAVVKGAVLAQGKNISIRGRGILAGEESPRFNGPGRYMLDCMNCENVTIKDIIIRNPWSWTFVTWNCQNVNIDGVKICGSRMINDDALDLVNTQNAVVKNCFFRTQDDCIAIKGLAGLKRPCENILIEDCIFWTDRANIFRIGYECETDGMRKITAKNIDVLYYSYFRGPSEYWAHAVIWLQPNQNMTMEDCHFEKFRIRSDGEDMTIVLGKPMSCKYGAFNNPEPGQLQNCTFSDFRVYGPEKNFKGLIYLKGDSQKHFVKNFTFEKIFFFDQPIGLKSPNVQLGDNTDNIVFK